MEKQIRSLVRYASEKQITIGQFEGVDFEIKQDGTHRVIKFGDQYFTADGNLRITVAESTAEAWEAGTSAAVPETPVASAPVTKKVPVKTSKVAAPKKAKKPAAKKSKTPKPAQLDKICECGKTFTTSKFTPYVTKCPECAKTSKAVKPAKIEKTCVECGTPFTTSKFTPNVTKCSECGGRKKASAVPVEKVCECGAKFIPSKFNPYMSKCPACRTSKKSDLESRIVKATVALLEGKFVKDAEEAKERIADALKLHTARLDNPGVKQTTLSWPQIASAVKKEIKAEERAAKHASEASTEETEK